MWQGSPLSFMPDYHLQKEAVWFGANYITFAYLNSLHEIKVFLKRTKCVNVCKSLWLECLVHSRFYVSGIFLNVIYSKSIVIIYDMPSIPLSLKVSKQIMTCLKVSREWPIHIPLSYEILFNFLITIKSIILCDHSVLFSIDMIL